MRTTIVSTRRAFLTETGTAAVAGIAANGFAIDLIQRVKPMLFRVIGVFGVSSANLSGTGAELRYSNPTDSVQLYRARVALRLGEYRCLT